MVFLGKTALTEAAGGAGRDALQGIHAEESQGVRPHKPADFLHRVAAGDEILLVQDIGAKVAGGDAGR